MTVAWPRGRLQRRLAAGRGIATGTGSGAG